MTDYGKLTLLTLPKRRHGPRPRPGAEQLQLRHRRRERSSTCCARGETEVIRGNLLTLPVGGGLLYVQPVYVQSTGETSYPLLRKVLVAFGDEIAFEDTLDAALDALFGGDSGADGGRRRRRADDPRTDPGRSRPTPSTPTEPGARGAPTRRSQAALADAQEALADRRRPTRPTTWSRRPRPTSGCRTALERRHGGDGE